MRTPLYRTVAFALLTITVSAGAQRPGADEPLTVRLSHSFGNGLRQGGNPAGRVSVDALSLAWRGSQALNATTRLNYGATWERLAFDRRAHPAVPATLHEIALNLGASRRLNERWLLAATVRPGLYGDLEDGADEAVQAPLLLLATSVQNPALSWAFGLRADWFSERPVVPLVGLNWRFAPDWELALGLPRSGISHRLTPDLQLALGASVQGGNFHLSRDPRPASVATGRRLDDTTLDYHEIRVGLAADWRPTARLSLTLEAGLITDQKFDYFERDLTVDGDPVGYVSVGLSARL